MASDIPLSPRTFFPNTGTGHEDRIQASTELAEFPKAQLSVRSVSVISVDESVLFCKEHAGDRTDGLSDFSNTQNDCQNCIWAILWL